LHDIEVEDVDLNEITQQAEQLGGHISTLKISTVTSEGSSADIFKYIENNNEGTSGETRKYGTGTSSIQAESGNSSSPKPGSKTTSKRTASETSLAPK